MSDRSSFDGGLGAISPAFAEEIHETRLQIGKSGQIAKSGRNSLSDCSQGSLVRGVMSEMFHLNFVKSRGWKVFLYLVGIDHIYRIACLVLGMAKDKAVFRLEWRWGGPLAFADGRGREVLRDVSTRRMSKISVVALQMAGPSVFER